MEPVNEGRIMIYPAVYNITLLQNSTWKAQVRVTQSKLKVIGIDIGGAGLPTFVAPCHNLANGSKVVFTGSQICGLEENTVYFVIAASPSAGTFGVSSTLGGASVVLSEELVGNLYVSTPIDITGYSVDGDIKELEEFTQVETFVVTLTAPGEGVFELMMSPEATLALGQGVYGYDVSLTSPNGERYYWLTGSAAVATTYSRS